MATVEDELRATERERLAAFLAKDIEALQRLHSDDFELINPGGQALSKRQYLDGVAAGLIEYRAWEADANIAVRVYDEAAVIRYRSELEVSVQGEAQPRQRFWHTDIYEKHDGRWQAVWSQATRISA